ncbi:uncharacterized protein LTR77_010748 [Saxophila tyrrhenica]|uniref:Uncharacterized protein n=1 Tax=Saxophila tyrrhenica TaxID=1690608 RepID=A0AAV9NVJ0_9PEZI|nr:hypothetical protein LTR77_010748 [Saxophila tyrrhenica]
MPKRKPAPPSSPPPSTGEDTSIPAPKRPRTRTTKPKKAEPEKTKASKGPSVFSCVSGMAPMPPISIKSSAKQTQKESVLVRPTARTRWMKEKARQAGREKARKAKVEREKQEGMEVRDEKVESRRYRMVGGFAVREGVAVRGPGGVEGGKMGGEEVNRLGARRAAASAVPVVGLGGIVGPGQVFQPGNRSGSLEVGGEKPDKGIFPVLDLPKELRDEIWRLAVVLPATFIYPEEKFGAEQPDLAMVSRFVRAEVLPIFYSENIFAIDASVDMPEKNGTVRRSLLGKKKSKSKGSVYGKWASVLEEKGWFGLIRKWCLCYEPRQTNIVMTHPISPGPKLQRDDRVMVSLMLQSRDSGFWGAEVEVHYEAACVFPKSKSAERCVVQNTPTWLNEAVIQLLNDASGRSVGGEMVLELARTVQSRGRELRQYRCVEAVAEVPPSQQSRSQKLKGYQCEEAAEEAVPTLASLDKEGDLDHWKGTTDQSEEFSFDIDGFNELA